MRSSWSHEDGTSGLRARVHSRTDWRVVLSVLSVLSDGAGFMLGGRVGALAWHGCVATPSVSVTPASASVQASPCRRSLARLSEKRVYDMTLRMAPWGIPEFKVKASVSSPLTRTRRSCFAMSARTQHVSGWLEPGSPPHSTSYRSNNSRLETRSKALTASIEIAHASMSLSFV